MNERHAIRYLSEREAGTGPYARPLPPDTVWLAPDTLAPGRLVPFGDGEPDGPSDPLHAGRDDVVWIGCERTTASRIPPARTKRSFRIRTLDREDNREVVFESTLEWGFWQIQRAGDRRRRIFEQPPRRTTTGPSGETIRHVFDLLVEEADGSRIAYAVRPHRLVERLGLDVTVAAFNRSGLEGFADRAEIRTERSITKSRVRNAVELLAARVARNAADVTAAAQLVAGLRGAVMLGQLVEALGIGPRGRVAILNLLDDRVLEHAEPSRITATSLLRPATTTTAR